jgi:NTE family protein
VAGCSRALVLGGGGSAGNAWAIGVIAGLFDAGLDVTEADLVVGTSSGSTTAVQVMSGPRPTELLSTILDAGPAAPHGARAVSGVAEHIERTNAIIRAATDAADMRRRMGAAALDQVGGSDDSAGAQRRALVAKRLPSTDWPQRPLLVVAVEAHTGEPAVFDRHSGVDLVDAVVASTAGPGAPAYRIGDSRYIDGGYRRNENADLASGYERVLVLSPFGGRTRHPLEWGLQLATQVEELRAGGSRVGTVFPDRSSLEAFGDNVMDPSTRPPAARAGYAQGQALAEQLGELWR